jgi:hypothetical protein
MKLANKIMLSWLAIIWLVFSVWLLAVTHFPLNFGVVGLEFIAGIILMWTMLANRDI